MLRERQIPVCRVRERDHVDQNGYAARDSAAESSEYADIVKTHERAVWNAASRICGNDCAADVAQDVFLKYWTSPEKFDPTRGTMRSYLVVMARGTAIDVIRHRTAQVRRDLQNTIEAPQPSTNHGRRLEQHDVAQRVSAAMSSLHAEDRDAIWLAYFQETTYREVARQLDIPEGTAKSRIRRGLKALYRELHDLDPVGELALAPVPV